MRRRNSADRDQSLQTPSESRAFHRREGERAEEKRRDYASQLNLKDAVANSKLRTNVFRLQSFIVDRYL